MWCEMKLQLQIVMFVIISWYPADYNKIMMTL